METRILSIRNTRTSCYIYCRSNKTECDIEVNGKEGKETLTESHFITLGYEELEDERPTAVGCGFLQSQWSGGQERTGRAGASAYQDGKMRRKKVIKCVKNCVSKKRTTLRIRENP